MNSFKNKLNGFTIVELLIVIVVIAILAAISMVAYNGIQTRAENAKTLSAVSAWAKALQMYKIDKGNYPTIHSCLGDTNTYTDSNNGVCWGDSANPTWKVNAPFLTALQNYMQSRSEPSSQNIYSAGDQRRGAMYYYTASGGEEIRVNIIGVTSLAGCPSISGLNPPFSLSTYITGSACQYKLPQ